MAVIRPQPKPQKRQRDKGYLAWLHLLPCCVPDCGSPCTDAHHTRLGTDGAMGRKPSDSAAVPLCHEHHRRLHDQGEKTFQQDHRLHLLSASRVYHQWYQRETLCGVG